MMNSIPLAARGLWWYKALKDAMECAMQVAKWGNSLAILIPTAVVEALELKEGDEVAVPIAGDRAVELARDDRRKRAIEKIKSFKVEFPADWKFDRDDANSR